MLCLILGLVCNVAWAEVLPTEAIKASQTLPTMGTPEYQFKVRATRNNGRYWSSKTVDTDEANAGKFAFYAVPGLANCYYIYSVTENKWVTYNKNNRNNQTDFVLVAENFDASAYWEITAATKIGGGACYQLRPTVYTTNQSGVLNIKTDRYANWYGGANGSSTLGLWQESPAEDEGSAWSLVSVDITGNLDALLAQRIAIANEVIASEAVYTRGDGILTAENVTSIVSSPYTRQDEGGIGGLVDGSVSDDGRKYWHSDWASEVVNGTHYFVVDLGEATYDLLSFSFSRRSAAADDHITRWAIYGVPADDTDIADGSRNGLTLLAMISTPFGSTSESFNNLPPFKTKGFKKFRFYADATNRNRGYFHIGEFQLYGNTLADSNTGDVKALVAALATAEEVTEATQKDIDDLNDKINVFLASDQEKAAARGVLDCVGPGYPVANNAQRLALQNVLERDVVVRSTLNAAVTAYKTTSAIMLPEDGKAYTIANYSYDNGGTKRYLNYTAGQPLSANKNAESPSVFVLHKLSEGKYVIITEDGKFLTWPYTNRSNADGYNNLGYSDVYGATKDNNSDWNEITIKRNSANNLEKDFGHLRLVGRRASGFSSFIIKGSDGGWDRAGDSYYLDESGSYYSSAWILTEETNHTNTPAQELALAKIAAIGQVKEMKLGSYYLVSKEGNKLSNLTSANAAINAAISVDEINTLLASRTLGLPTAGKAYYLKDSQGAYLDIHHLVVEANDRNGSTQLASLSKTKQILYITGNETDGTWKIHTAPEGGKYLHQKPSSRVWNSWVSDAGGDFKWEVEGVDVSGTPHYMLKNISGSENGILGPNNSNHTNAGEPLFVNQSNDANKLKMQLLPVKSITGLASTGAEWLNEESVDVTEIPAGITALGNYTQVRSCGEYFYINAGRLTGLFKWRNGSGSQKVNIVGVEVVGLDDVVVDADYHVGATGTSHSNNTYAVEVPADGLYYLRYYTETNTNAHNSDVDITYTLLEKNVYIAADAKQPDGTYKKLYLYNDNGTLKASSKFTSEDKFKWIRSTVNGNHTFANKAGQSLGYDHNSVKGLVIADEAVALSINTSDAVHTGSMGMKRIGDDNAGKFMVTKFDGSSFNRNTGKTNDGTWTSDYVLIPANIDELTLAKFNAENNELRNVDFGAEVCQYHYVKDEVNVYETPVIEDIASIEELNAIISSISINLPEVGKYYRIKGKNSGNYIDAVNCYSGTQMGMKSASERDFLGSIFLLDEGNRLLNMGTNTYVKETRHIGADKNGANTWTFNPSTRTAGCLTLTAAGGGSGAAVQLHANSGNRADRCQSICNDGTHDFILEEVKAYTLTIDAPAIVGATATWNGETKALPATWALFEGSVIANPALIIKSSSSYRLDGLFENGVKVEAPVEITSLDANRAFTTQFTLDIFSSAYGEKWVNIVRATKAGHAIKLASADAASPTFNNLDYSDEGMLWCLVGTAEEFKIYSKVGGDSKALTPNPEAQSIGDGTTVAMVASANAQSWHLIGKNDGYAIAPVGNNDWSINSYGGDNALGSQIKFYGAGDAGSHWNFNVIDVENPITLNVEVDQVWTSSPRVAELTFTVNGKASQTRIEGSVPGKKMYLPVGSTYEVSSMTYRGYTYEGYDEVDGVLTASYTANEERTLYYSRRDGHPYRIPAIATAPNGDIFAICDYRPCGADIGNGDVDIVVRISKDNGETWGEEFKIADGDGGSTNRMETGYGDPAIVADRESDKLLVMMVAGRTTCWNGRWESSKEGDPNASAVNRVARVYGTYDVASGEWQWTAPVEMTDHIYSLFMDGTTPTVTSMFIGSGKICQSRVVKKGQYYRLYCALWTRDGGNRVIYSDDFGGTWNVLGTINDRPASGGDEPKCEELPDGTVVLSSRKSGGRYFNLFTFNNEGKSEDEKYTTGSWGTVATSTSAYDGSANGTNGEIYKVKAIRKADGKICDVMLQSIPAGPGRANVKVYYKEMDYTTAYTPATFAADWKVGKHVSTKGSAYSTMILQADGRLGFFFEEEPSDYCMVYIPYTIEDVTDNKYSLYTVNSTISEYGVGTFYASEAMQIPEGVKAYVTNELKKEGETGVLTLTELEGIIPAKTGALIFGEQDVYKFIPSISYGTAVENNMLVGFEAGDNNAESTKEVTLSNDYTTYVLAVKNEKAGFYRKDTDFVVANNKAYLNIPTEQASNVLRIRFGKQEGTTEIETSEIKAQESELIYDLMGRPVEKMEKGIYIVNGKKVVVK